MQKKTTSSNFELKNVNIWNAEAVLKNQTLRVESGVVVSIETSKDSQPSQNSTLIPIGVDPQVHLRVPGQPEKETPATGLESAIAGGIGALLTMPNTKPVIDTPEVLAIAREAIELSGYANDVKVLYSAAITKQQRGKEAVDFLALAHAGVSAFTDDGLGVASDDIMRLAFRASAETGLPILQHAEMPGHGGVLAPGKVQKSLGLDPAYDEMAEVNMVARDLNILKDYPGARYHVLHISSAKTMDLVVAAREKGMLVSCEVSPHHLFFSSDDIDANNSAFKMNPPLRSAHDVARLRAGLRDGFIDFVATDHAPHEEHVKSLNFKTSAFGTIGLETSLRVLLDLHYKGELSPTKLVSVFSQAPARFLGLENEFGEIKVGRAFRAVAIDPTSPPKPFLDGEIRSKSHNSCFLGAPLAGALTTVYTGQNTFSL